MALAVENPSETVQLRHHYNAPREQVFRAWTDPEALGQWFGPQSHTCKVEKLDVREGGDYQLRLIPTDENEDSDCGGNASADSICAGTFVSIQAPEKLVMTFGWIQNGADISDTLISVRFVEADGGTDLVLTHERLPTEEMRQAHAGGWQSSLECLETFLRI